jgi:hypothetical protein
MIHVGLSILNSYSDLLSVSQSALPLTIALLYAARYVVPFFIYSPMLIKL